MIGYIFGSAASLGVATILGYNSMAPRSQLFGTTFVGLEPGSKQVALTFDDGPNDLHTLRLMEVLERHGVKATFFMLGRYVQQRPREAQAVAHAGHAIGNHTFTHPNLIFCSPSRIRKELEDCRRVLNDTVGEHTNLFRPPFGGRRPDVLRIARSMGFEPVMWSFPGRDWNHDPPETVEKRIVLRVRGGDVILLHDGGHLALGTDRSASVTAVERLIPRLKQEGYSFVTIPEMTRHQR